MTAPQFRNVCEAHSDGQKAGVRSQSSWRKFAPQPHDPNAPLALVRSKLAVANTIV
jgi:hypothetical protein